MCLDCGCDRPDDDHGDPRHITYAMLQAAALASRVDPEVAAVRIHAALLRIRDALCHADEHASGTNHGRARSRV